MIKKIIFIGFGMLAPLIANAQFVSVSGIPTSALDVSNTETLFADLFVIFVSVATILGTIKLMMCGIQYMTSESISSKGAAKTCISYVIGGLFLILLSVLLLQTINKQLVEGSFETITESVRDGVGDVSNLSEDIALDGDSGAGAGLPGGGGGGTTGWHLEYAGSGLRGCSGSHTESFDDVSSCRQQESAIAGQFVYKVEQGCASVGGGSGDYRYTLSNTCSGGSLTQTFRTSGECGTSLNEFRAFTAYVITESCFYLD